MKRFNDIEVGEVMSEISSLTRGQKLEHNKGRTLSDEIADSIIALLI